MDGEAPGLLQFEFQWFFSSHGSGRALILWVRSVEKNKLRYTVVISDGDAKMISRLNSEHPYGSDVLIQVITFMLILFIFMVISNLFTFMITNLFTFIVITNLFIFMLVTNLFLMFFFTPSEDGVHGTVQKRLGGKNA